MPSDPLVFNELKLPFIFVPHGEPEPTEWMQDHPDYIKLPATFVPRDGSDGQADQVAGVHPQPLAPGGSTGAAAESSDPGGAVPQAENAGFDEAPATSGVASPSNDPIAAYRAANEALDAAASGYAPGRADRSGASTGSLEASDATGADRTHTDAGPATPFSAFGPYDSGNPLFSPPTAPSSPPPGADQPPPPNGIE